MNRASTHSWLSINVWLLVFLVFFSANALILVKHYGRIEVMRAQDLRQEYDGLKIRWFSLQEARNSLITPARIQSVAENQYDMHVPTRKVTKLIVIDEEHVR